MPCFWEVRAWQAQPHESEACASAGPAPAARLSSAARPATPARPSAPAARPGNPGGGANRPAGPSANRPAGPSTNRPAGPSANQPTGPSTNRPAGPTRINQRDPARIAPQALARITQRDPAPIAPQAPARINRRDPAPAIRQVPAPALDRGRLATPLCPGDPTSTSPQMEAWCARVLMGAISDIHNPKTGMNVHNGLNGNRAVVVERPDHSRVFAERGRPGYVQRPYSFHGQNFAQRTYVYNGHEYSHFYRGYSYPRRLSECVCAGVLLPARILRLGLQPVGRPHHLCVGLGRKSLVWLLWLLLPAVSGVPLGCILAHGLRGLAGFRDSLCGAAAGRRGGRRTDGGRRATGADAGGETADRR